MRETISAIHLRLWRLKIRLLPWTRPRPVPRLALPPGDPAPVPPEPLIETPEQLWSEVLVQYLPPLEGRTMLVLGCGEGELVRYLADFTPVARLIGVDSEQYWNAGSVPEQDLRDGRIRLLAGELPGLGIGRRSVDAIVCVGYLEYLSPEAVERTLTACYELLSPGGSLIVRTQLCTAPAPTGAHERFASPYPQLLASERDLARLLRARFNERLPYTNWLTATSYVMLFHWAGFEIMQARRLGGEPPGSEPQSLTRALPGTARNELINCLEAHLIRPFTLDDLAQTGGFEDTRPLSARGAVATRGE
jgi:SAM-dependent methyltransferase